MILNLFLKGKTSAWRKSDDKFNLVILKAVAFVVVCLRTLTNLKHVIFKLFSFITVPESTELSLPD